LDIVPNSPIDKQTVIHCLQEYAKTEGLPISIITKLEDKIEDNQGDGHTLEKSFSLALCWLYTTDSWVYSHINTQLRDDSRTMSTLAPYMNALMKAYNVLTDDDSYFYSGILFRRTRLTQKGLEFYKPQLQFVWSAFTSTSVEFSSEAQFGDILFVISIPEKFKFHALNLEGLSAFPTEREVLLLPNIGFRVKSTTPGPTPEYPNTKIIIHIIAAWMCVV